MITFIDPMPARNCKCGALATYVTYGDGHYQHFTCQDHIPSD